MPDGDPIPAGGAAPAAPARNDVDATALQNEIELLRRQNAQLQSGYERMRPYEAEISRMLDDADYADFVRHGTSAFDRAREEARNAGVPAEMRPLAAKLDKIDAFVDELAQERARAAEYAKSEPRRRWDAQCADFFRDVIAKNPDLDDNKNGKYRPDDPARFGWAAAVQTYAERAGVPIEKAWDEMAPAFTKKPASAAPPPSLRQDAGVAGLPPRSRTAAAPSTFGDPPAPSTFGDPPAGADARPPKLKDLVLAKLNELNPSGAR